MNAELGMVHPNAGVIHPRNKCEKWAKDKDEAGQAHRECVPAFSERKPVGMLHKKTKHVHSVEDCERWSKQDPCGHEPRNCVPVYSHEQH